MQLSTTIQQGAISAYPVLNGNMKDSNQRAGLKIQQHKINH